MGFLKSVKNIFFKDEIEDDYEEYDEFDEELNKHARTIKSYLDEEDMAKKTKTLIIRNLMSMMRVQDMKRRKMMRALTASAMMNCLWVMNVIT